MVESNWNRDKRRFAEPAHREIRRANLDRLGRTVVESMGVAGDTPLPEEWRPILERIDIAYRQNPELLVVVLWRLLCDFSFKMAKRKIKTKLQNKTKSGDAAR
jgi:hypothetical protein